MRFDVYLKVFWQMIDRSNSSTASRALFIFEFGPRADDNMMGELIAALARRFPHTQMYWFTGLIKEYVAGGTRPSRILNLVYMYLALPFVVLAKRPDIIFVRTTPPCIQLWTCLIGRMAGARIGCWLMDYHPEIEAVSLSRRAAFRWLASALRAVDGILLRKLDFAVVLDDAMERLVKSRAESLSVLQHPTWNTCSGTFDLVKCPDYVANRRGLRLVYAGNLGRAHALGALEALICHLKRNGPVHLVTVGASKGGEIRFREMADRAGITLQCLSRVPFSELGALFHKMQVDAGVVLLSDRTAGLVSPSKFSAYIFFGVPVVYIGPPGTSSDAVCSRFGAGFSIRNGALDVELKEVAEKLWDVPRLVRARECTRLAAEYYMRRNGESLAQMLAPFFGETSDLRDDTMDGLESGRSAIVKAEPRRDTRAEPTKLEGMS